MRFGRKRLGALAALSLLAGLLIPAQAAQAQPQTFDVEVGSFFNDAGAEGNRFYPETLNVHQGDTLHFTIGFHTATLLPAGQDTQEWVDANATGLAEPWNFVQPDADEGGLNLKANNRVAFPTSQSCGMPGQPACTFDGSAGEFDGGVLNSGVPLGPVNEFSVTITAAPGSSIGVVCLIHTNMQMTINVVPESEPISSPEEVAAAAAALIEQDHQDALDLVDQLSKPVHAHGTAKTKVKHVDVGFDTEHLSLFGMFPNKTTIRKGQKVRFHFDSLRFEIHTASIPRGTALDIAQGFFAPNCDPDGDAGPGPDTPPTMPDPPFCDDPAQLEFDVPAEAVGPVGNGRFAGGNDYESSGILGEGGLSKDPWDVKFTKKTGKKGVKYICIVHPDMVGKVIVKKQK